MNAEERHATATIEKIDKANRHLTLRGEDGKDFTVTVPPEVKRFDELKKGERISLDYYESVGVSFQKMEPGTEMTTKEAEVLEREPTKLPGGMMARKLTRSAQVTQIDHAKGLVTFKAPNGETHTLRATDPAAKSQLQDVQKGDMVQMTYTEGVALNVQPKAKAGEKEKRAKEREGA